MSLLDRYVARAILLHFGLALGGFVLIFSVIAFMEEMRSVGEGSYGLATAAWFVLLRLPAESFELFPGAALVGCVMGLGALAARGELVAMHACGVSYLRLARSVLQTAALAGVAMLAFAELVAAPLARSAHVLRADAVSGGTALASANGLWTRADGAFVNVRNPMNDGTLHDVFLYEFDAQHRLSHYTHARGGSHDANGWLLEDVTRTTLHEEGMDVRHIASEPWQGLPLPRGVQTMMLPAEDIALADLDATIATLAAQQLLTHRYELAYWKRLTTPAIALVMMLVAMPLVLGSIGDRQGRRGGAIVVAALAGVGFQMFNQTFGTFAVVYRVPPLLGAVAPGALALLAGLWGFRRLR
jgi:lipopolysaccharide export system permease protein